MRALIPALALLLVAVPLASAAPPPTVYESSTMTPENMDYDATNKTFKAHSGWLNDKLVHYYKFRMYTPMTYPDHVKMEGTPTIPVMPLYLASRDGTMDGLVLGQNPVLRYHHADGGNYSDFVEIVLVDVPDSHVPNAFRSWSDIERSGARLVPTGAIVNAPLVPVGSKLEAPGGGVAPISPVAAWYDGEAVQLFYFETTSQAFADKFNPLTRVGTAGQNGSGSEIVVTPFAKDKRVNFIPIWHLNQYGAMVAGQGGGPDAHGQRNIIDKDRKDPGYSPLWQVFWVSKLPIGYEASQASHADQVTEANGFAVMQTPMFVNCPNIGPHGGGEMNARKASSFNATARAASGEVMLQGALVMEAGKNVTARTGGKSLGTATTGMMGAYKIPVAVADLPAPENRIEVVDPAGTVVATFNVAKGDAAATPPTGGTPATTTPAPAPGIGILALLAALGVAGVTMRRRG